MSVIPLPVLQCSSVTVIHSSSPTLQFGQHTVICKDTFSKNIIYTTLYKFSATFGHNFHCYFRELGAGNHAGIRHHKVCQASLDLRYRPFIWNCKIWEGYYSLDTFSKNVIYTTLYEFSVTFGHNFHRYFKELGAGISCGKSGILKCVEPRWTRDTGLSSGTAKLGRDTIH